MIENKPSYSQEGVVTKEHKNGFVIEEYSRERLLSEPVTLDKLATTFRGIFKEEPWDRYKKVKGTNIKFGIKEYQKLIEAQPNTCNEIVDYYPPEVVKDKILSELNDDDTIPSLHIAFEADSEDPAVLGFLWGCTGKFDYIHQKVMNQYFKGLPEADFLRISSKMHDRLKLLRSLEISDLLSFVSAMAVVKDRRGDANTLAQLLQAATTKHTELGSDRYIFRTIRKSTIYPVVTLLKGEEIYSYDEDPITSQTEDYEKEGLVFVSGNMRYMRNIIEQYPGDKIFHYFLDEMRKQRQTLIKS